MNHPGWISVGTQMDTDAENIIYKGWNKISKY